MNEATQRLIDLGLSRKEAEVYLALLELGSTGAQDISQKAGVNRSTAYQILETLKRRGLASSTDGDKKVVFTAAPPSQLDAVLSRERKAIEEKQRKLADTIPYFMALYNAMEEKPVVRFFEGEEGVVAAREEMMKAKGEFLSFTAVDEGTVRMSEIQKDQRLRMSRRMRGKFLYALKPGFQMPEVDIKYWQVRKLSYEQFPFTGEINIVDDYVVAWVVKAKPMAFLVQSHEMSELFRVLFFLAWQGAQPVDVRLFERKDSE